MNLRANWHCVTADGAKFQQIIWNLLKNAIKFTPDGGDITISSDNPSESVFNVSVHDTGIGMEPEVMQRIFDPFEQGNRSFEHRFGGLGLGLAISKSLAQAHGGTLTAESDGFNRGSTFRLSMQALPQGEAVSIASNAVTDSVRHATRIPKPFQRFFNDSMEAVETANYSLGAQFTWLKPGVNDSATFLWS